MGPSTVCCMWAEVWQKQYSADIKVEVWGSHPGLGWFLALHLVVMWPWTSHLFLVPPSINWSMLVSHIGKWDHACRALFQTEWGLHKQSCSQSLYCNYQSVIPIIIQFNYHIVVKNLLDLTSVQIHFSHSLLCLSCSPLNKIGFLCIVLLTQVFCGILNFNNYNIKYQKWSLRRMGGKKEEGRLSRIYLKIHLKQGHF